jgi:transmembrane sensor
MEENEFHLLVWQKLRGNINQTDLEILHQWLGQSSDNQRIAEEIEQIWAKSATTNQPVNVDLEEEYQRLLNTIQTDKQPKRLSLWGNQWLKIAATLLFVIAAVWMFQQNSTPSINTIEKIANQGRNEQVLLADGSIVWLKEGATVSYPETFEVTKRTISLKGEAYFEVAHNPKQPFSVILEDSSLVEVLGTKFNINASIKAAETTVFVSSGKVRFSKDAQSVVLQANEKGVFDRKNNKINSVKSLTSNDLAWHSGGLSFAKTPLSEVANDFEKFYGISLEIAQKEMQTCTFTAPMLQQNVTDALNTLALTYSFEVVMLSENKYLLKGGKCN